MLMLMLMTDICDSYTLTGQTDAKLPLGLAELQLLNNSPLDCGTGALALLQAAQP